MRIAYSINGREFPSQMALEKAIKQELKTMPRDTVVANDFLREVVNTLHPDVLQSGNKSDGRFRLLSWQEQRKLGMKTAEQYRGGELMQTYFIPLDRWQDVTVYPWRRPPARSQVVQALRSKASDFIPAPTLEDQCAVEGCCTAGYALQYHHVDPTFSQMIKQAMAFVKPAEIEDLFGYDKFADGTNSVADFISNDHPAVLYLRAAHRVNKWAWLCRTHHEEITRGKSS